MIHRMILIGRVVLIIIMALLIIAIAVEIVGL